jgi:hypothetical protein
MDPFLQILDIVDDLVVRSSRLFHTLAQLKQAIALRRASIEAGYMNKDARRLENIHLQNLRFQ